MTVDGPEIGTLVMVCDRAKNLPNRKTMGKQNPYCAARLGKEAKKTNVDKRGGQTPRWYVCSVIDWLFGAIGTSACANFVFTGTPNYDSQYTTRQTTTTSSYQCSAKTRRRI
jgi:hypothetical protein